MEQVFEIIDSGLYLYTSVSNFVTIITPSKSCKATKTQELVIKRINDDFDMELGLETTLAEYCLLSREDKLESVLFPSLTQHACSIGYLTPSALEQYSDEELKLVKKRIDTLSSKAKNLYIAMILEKFMSSQPESRLNEIFSYSDVIAALSLIDVGKALYYVGLNPLTSRPDILISSALEEIARKGSNYKDIFKSRNRQYLEQISDGKLNIVTSLTGDEVTEFNSCEYYLHTWNGSEGSKIDVYLIYELEKSGLNTFYHTHHKLINKRYFKTRNEYLRNLSVKALPISDLIESPVQMLEIPESKSINLPEFVNFIMSV